MSEKAGRGFVSLQVEMELTDPVPEEKLVAGVDLGINRKAQFSDNTFMVGFSDAFEAFPPSDSNTFPKILSAPILKGCSLEFRKISKTRSGEQIPKKNP